jgi:hypothetical protein
MLASLAGEDIEAAGSLVIGRLVVHGQETVESGVGVVARIERFDLRQDDLDCWTTELGGAGID